MNIIALNNGSWFDADRAQHWRELKRGSISVNTGDSHSRQSLYRTAKGIYVIEHYSILANVQNEYEVIGMEAAARWLIANFKDLPDDLAQYEKELEI